MFPFCQIPRSIWEAKRGTETQTSAPNLSCKDRGISRSWLAFAFFWFFVCLVFFFKGKNSMPEGIQGGIELGCTFPPELEYKAAGEVVGACPPCSLIQRFLFQQVNP